MDRPATPTLPRTVHHGPSLAPLCALLLFHELLHLQDVNTAN